MDNAQSAANADDSPKAAVMLMSSTLLVQPAVCIAAAASTVLCTSHQCSSEPPHRHQHDQKGIAYVTVHCKPTRSLHSYVSLRIHSTATCLHVYAAYPHRTVCFDDVNPNPAAEPRHVDAGSITSFATNRS